MSTLPQCKKVSRLHVLHSVYIAVLQKRTTISKPDILDIPAFDCNKDGKIAWQTCSKGAFRTLLSI